LRSPIGSRLGDKKTRKEVILVDVKINMIVPTIMEEMQTDRDNESWGLLHHYKACDAKERAAFDAVLLFLCGWTFETILEKCGLKLAEDGVAEC
jgi:hypothetical protein